MKYLGIARNLARCVLFASVAVMAFAGTASAQDPRQSPSNGNAKWQRCYVPPKPKSPNCNRVYCAKEITCHTSSGRPYKSCGEWYCEKLN